MVSSKGKRTEVHSPYRMDIEIRPTSEFTWKMSMYDIAVDATPMYARYRIFLEAGPWTSAIPNLKAVSDIQYSEL